MWTVYLIVLYLRQKLLSALNLRVLPHDSDKTLESANAGRFFLA